VLSHQRLAEEERRAADARSAPSRLEERVQVLTRRARDDARLPRVIGESAELEGRPHQATKVAQAETTCCLYRPSPAPARKSSRA
jgi:hypothetical protein